MRATCGRATRQRRNRVLKRAKGFRGGRHALFRTAKCATLRAEQYAFIGRRQKKRNFRRLWITRLSAACRMRGVSYSRFIAALRKANVGLNRKMMSEIAIHDPAAFDRLLECVSDHLERHAA